MVQMLLTKNYGALERVLSRRIIFDGTTLLLIDKIFRRQARLRLCEEKSGIYSKKKNRVLPLTGINTWEVDFICTIVPGTLDIFSSFENNWKMEKNHLR